MQNELLFLSETFKKIIIYPNDYYSSEESHTRTLPVNVEILNLNRQIGSNNANKLLVLLNLIKIGVTEWLLTDDRKNFVKNFRWNFLNLHTQYLLAGCFSSYLKTKELPPNNCVFYSYWFHKSALMLAILKRNGTINNFVSRAHSVDLYHHKWGIINQEVKVPPFKMFKLKQTDRVFAVSEHGANFLRESFPAFSRKMATAYLGVLDTSQHLNKKEVGAFHIVTCSGIDENKRVHRLAETLAGFGEEINWTHFGDGQMKPLLDACLKKCPANIRVSLKGSVANAAVIDYYAHNRVDVFINLSRVEGLPVSIMEAMVHEVPIVATRVYGVPEAVHENVNGFLLDVDFTNSDLAETLNYCIHHRSELREMGKKSREIFLSKFLADKNYTEFAKQLISTK